MEKKHKIYVWSKVTRLFHWGLVAAFVTTLVSAKFSNALLIHISAGSTMGILLSLRVLWGFTGPKYSRFKNFDFNLKDLLYYFFKLFKDKKLYIGHNPAASWATFLLIILGVFTTFSGWMLLGAQKVRGVWAFLAHDPTLTPLLLKVHVLGKNIMLSVALIHIVGVLLEHFWHKTSIVTSMVDGYKFAPIGIKDIVPTKAQNHIGMGFLILAFITGVGVWKWNQSPLIGAHPDLIYYHKEFPEFANECSSRHAMMPPLFLTKKSWEVALSDPNDHFYVDISAKVPNLESIKEYILANSAQTSINELAKGVSETSKGRNVYRVTRTKYWKDLHSSIPREIYSHPYIKSQSRCDACHNNFGVTNYIDNEDITLKHLSLNESLKIYLKI